MNRTNNIRVEIFRDKEGFIRQFSVRGHAGYAEKGRDIVCAAISATAFTALGALEELAGLKDFYTERDGYILCSIPIDISPECKITVKTILETTVIGFKQIEHSYRKYVTVLDEEV